MEQQGIHGSCACGNITFRCSELPQQITFCYCLQCAKVSGAGYLPFIAVSPSSVRWSRQPDVWKSSKVAERGYCASCGSALTMQYLPDKDEISLVLNAVDNSDDLKNCVHRHIFLKEKAAWVTVPDDGTARYESHEPRFQKLFESWLSEASKSSDKR